MSLQIFIAIFLLSTGFVASATLQEQRYKKAKKITEFSLRTNTSYDNKVKDIEQLPYLTSLYGIRRNSCLNRLSYFHSIDEFPPDLSHDLFEGIAIDILSNIISQLIETSHLTVVNMNSTIKHFEYCEIDKQKKPQEFKVILSN